MPALHQESITSVLHQASPIPPSKNERSMADQAAVLEHPGFTFRPADHELISLFLRPKVAGEPFDARFIHHADVYAAVPADLVAKRKPASGTDNGNGQKSSAVWYFFCPARYKSASAGSAGRRQRAVGEGCWKSEGGPKAVRGPDGRRVGHLQRFSYGVSTSPGCFSRLGWCMVEFRLDQQDGGGCDLVLCKVYRSPRAQASMAAKAALSCSGSKRKAAEDHLEAPPSVRPQRTTTNGQQLLQELERLLFDDDPTPVPAEFDAQAYFRAMMGDELEGVPPSAPNAEPEQLDDVAAGVEFVQTVHGLCSDDEFIASLAAGETVDDLLGPSTSGECGGGDLLPCPSMEERAYVEKLLSASGDDMPPSGSLSRFMNPSLRAFSSCSVS